LTVQAYTAAAVTDYLDGYFARAWKQQSKLGRIFDPIADKLLVASTILLLVAFKRVSGLDVLAALVILCREVLVSGLREFLAELRAKLPVSRLAKWKTGMQMTALGFLIVGDAQATAWVPVVLIGEVLLWIAAALTLMRRSAAERRGLAPLAVIVGHATHAQEPGLFTTAPVGAIAKLYAKTGWSTADVDLFEINEAFAVVTMAAMKEHGLAHESVNVHGGACALGHPIGASGARIVVTLLGALRKHGKRRGIASLCIGGGEATAMAIELA